MEKLFYVETGIGCCLRTGRTAHSVRNKVLREVGTYNGVRLVREAEDSDIKDVRSMNGYMPDHPRIAEVIGANP